MTPPEPVIAVSEEIRFPKLYFAIKWTIIASSIFMEILAAAFWVLVLGGSLHPGSVHPTQLLERARVSCYAGVCLAFRRERARRQDGMPDVL